MISGIFSKGNLVYQAKGKRSQKIPLVGGNQSMNLIIRANVIGNDFLLITKSYSFQVKQYIFGWKFLGKNLNNWVRNPLIKVFSYLVGKLHWNICNCIYWSVYLHLLLLEYWDVWEEYGFLVGQTDHYCSNILENSKGLAIWIKYNWNLLFIRIWTVV